MNSAYVTLKPVMTGRCFHRMGIDISLAGLSKKAGDELCRMALSTVTIPGCDPQDFTVSDESGCLSVKASFLSAYPYEYKLYSADRDIVGTVSVSYTVFPRPYAETDSCGPYFDLKAEDGGANTAGLSILPVFEGFEGKISLAWDFSEAPAGVSGVNTFGENNISFEGIFEKLRQSYYSFGFLNSITEGDFGFYWLAEPDFDVQAIADYTKKLYGVMSSFFHDTESVYRIFFRKDPPYPGCGGTALLRSYMCGWNENKTVNVKEMQNILAHEMVHNWPNLNDEPYGTTSWYSEGTAEYYSIMLPLRAGLISVETALYEIQRRTDAYYTNPTRMLENLEAAKIAWQDRRAQRLAYGRGIFFLANCDVKIRCATAGKACIDDVVLRILERGRRGDILGNEIFLEEIQKVSGLDLTEDWETMRTGRHFAPLSGSFDGYFSISEVESTEADTGKPCVSYKWMIKN